MITRKRSIIDFKILDLNKVNRFEVTTRRHRQSRDLWVLIGCHKDPAMDSHLELNCDVLSKKP